MTYMGEERRRSTVGTDALRKVERTDRWVKRLAIALLTLLFALQVALGVALLLLLEKNQQTTEAAEQQAIINGELLRRLDRFERDEKARREVAAAKSDERVRGAIDELVRRFREDQAAADARTRDLLQQVLDAVLAELNDTDNREDRRRVVLVEPSPRPRPSPRPHPRPGMSPQPRPSSSPSASPRPSPSPSCLVFNPANGRCIVRPGGRS